MGSVRLAHEDRDQELPRLALEHLLHRPAVERLAVAGAFDAPGRDLLCPCGVQAGCGHQPGQRHGGHECGDPAAAGEVHRPLLKHLSHDGLAQGANPVVFSAGRYVGRAAIWRNRRIRTIQRARASHECERLRLHHRGRRLGRLRARQPAERGWRRRPCCCWRPVRPTAIPDLDPARHGRMHDRLMFDWGYETDAEPNLNGRTIEAMRGKVLGGSSSINVMAYTRGNRGDYDRWAQKGARGWSYADVLPYFRRAETWEGGENTWRGGSGPLGTEYAKTPDPLFDAWLEAGKAVGLPPDVGLQRQDPGRLRPRPIHDPRRPAFVVGARLSAAREAATQSHGRDRRACDARHAAGHARDRRRIHDRRRRPHAGGGRARGDRCRAAPSTRRSS